MKKTMILSGILAVLLIATLTIIGFNIKNQNKEYKELEDTIEKVAIAYYGEYPTLIKNNGTIETNDLVQYDENINMIINGDECTGYVKTKSNMGIYEYKAYIKCQNYTTPGYNN